MSPYALYAFLYDFAPKYIGGTKSYLIKNLPEPKAAFFIGGAPNDPYYQLTEGTIREIKEDRRLADLPLVRKNMQGINGVEIPPSIYNYLQQLTATPTPPIEYLAERDSPDICTEKDVEDLLVKPLLKKLGYDEAEYAQQY